MKQEVIAATEGRQSHERLLPRSAVSTSGYPRGLKRAVMTVARALLDIGYYILTDSQGCRELGAGYLEQCPSISCIDISCVDYSASD